MSEFGQTLLPNGSIAMFGGWHQNIDGTVIARSSLWLWHPSSDTYGTSLHMHPPLEVWCASMLDWMSTESVSGSATDNEIAVWGTRGIPVCRLSSYPTPMLVCDPFCCYSHH
jgi:hypothetical protein